MQFLRPKVKSLLTRQVSPHAFASAPFVVSSVRYLDFQRKDFTNKQMSNEDLIAHIVHQLGRWLSQGQYFSNKEMQLINQITNRRTDCLGEMVDSSIPATMSRCPLCKSTGITELGVIANID